MSMVFILVGISITLAACFLGAFVWAALNGQFRDCATPAMRMLHDTTQRRILKQETEIAREGAEHE